METLKFKTTINCGGCISTVTPTLNKIAGTDNWNVDINSVDKILTIHTNQITPKQIQEAVQSLGFQISQL
ncbi:MAG: heavy-metal-associated domain-containing protein [Ignavibacteriae bacterium]|nr:heavy-metal-associated domain-containing protein [Ignavibacteriota bacterium]